MDTVPTVGSSKTSISMARFDRGCLMMFDDVWWYLAILLVESRNLMVESCGMSFDGLNPDVHGNLHQNWWSNPFKSINLDTIIHHVWCIWCSLPVTSPFLWYLVAHGHHWSPPFVPSIRGQTLSARLMSHLTMPEGWFSRPMGFVPWPSLTATVSVFGSEVFLKKLMDFLRFHPTHPSFMGLEWWV